MNPVEQVLDDMQKALEQDLPRDWGQDLARIAELAPQAAAGSSMAYFLGRVAEECGGDRQARILDYGCGGARLLMLLWIMGWRNLRGVDVEIPAPLAALAAKLGMPEGALLAYDTKTLPYPDASFDLVVSQQVLEHVHNLDDYYREAARVLRPGGKALLDFPHRLIPYDSHARLWFAHWLPKSLRRPLYQRLTTQGAGYFEDILNFQTLGVHRRVALRHFSSFANLTHQRIASYSYAAHYEGARGLRQLADRAFRLPLVGRPLLHTLSSFAAAHVVLVK
jgi:SAM-dependent methyltransferase